MTIAQQWWLVFVCMVAFWVVVGVAINRSWQQPKVEVSKYAKALDDLKKFNGS